MNLYKQFVKETNLKADYVKWLEKKVASKDIEPEIDDNSIVNDSVIDDDDGISIDYSNPLLGYEVEIVFPRHLTSYEQEQVKKIIDYWSALPFVSVEGNYGIEWERTNKEHKAIVSINFTKSASFTKSAPDDYEVGHILKRLGEFIRHGTPIRKRTLDRKWEGVIKPIQMYYSSK